MANRATLLRVNSIASLVYQVVALVCGFILPRLIMGYYGSAVNGLISSITQFLGIITLCELGMGAVVPASLYKPLATKDQDAISKVVLSSERFYRKVAVLMVVYVAFLTAFYPVIIDDFSYFYTASLVIILAISTFVQYFFGITYSLLISADQRQYIIYLVNGGTIVINLAISFVLIREGCSIHLVKLISALIFITRPFFFSQYVKSHYRLNRKVVYHVEPIKQKWNGVAQHLAYTIQDKTGVVVLSLMATLQEVSVYSVYFLILEGVRGLIYSVTSSLTSYLGNILAKEERDALNKDFTKIEWSLHTITVMFFSAAAVLIIPFVSVYTAGINDADYIVPIFPYLMCGAIGVRCLQMPYNIVVQASGHFRETQNSAIIEPFINICLSFLLIGKLGLCGVAIGMLASMIYRMLYLSIYLTNNILYSSKGLLCKRLFVDAVMVILIAVVCSRFTIGQLSYLAWGKLALEVMTTVVVICTVVNLFFYKRLTLGILSGLVRSLNFQVKDDK